MSWHRDDLSPDEVLDKVAEHREEIAAAFERLSREEAESLRDGELSLAADRVGADREQALAIASVAHAVATTGAAPDGLVDDLIRARLDVVRKERGLDR